MSRRPTRPQRPQRAPRGPHPERRKAAPRRGERAPARGSDAGAALAAPPVDGAVLLATALLAGLGVVMIYSATAPLAMGRALPPHFLRHLAAVVLGAAAAAVALRVPLVLWRRLAVPLWGAALGLLALTLLFGAEVNGARRWLTLPALGLGLQPAEPAKWATLLAVAALLARGTERRALEARHVRAALGLAAAPALLLLLQPDFGSAAILCALVGLLLFAAGTPLRLLFAPAAVGGAGVAAYVVLQPYALARWRGFLDPWRQADAEGFQLVQSFVAFGRGGSFGVGLGDGRQKLFYLPEAHTDFMLSLVAEELGLLGVLVVLGAFAALLVAGMRIARRARDAFALLLAVGMTGLVVVPALVNAAVVTGLVPTTGLTLPFLSYGRTSLVMCAVAVGILLRVAREAPADPKRVRGAFARGLVGS